MTNDCGATPTFPDWRETPTLSIAEAAKWMGISRPTAYAHAKSGVIPTIKIGGSVRVSTRELAELLRLPVSEQVPGDEQPSTDEVNEVQSTTADVRGEDQ